MKEKFIKKYEELKSEDFDKKLEELNKKVKSRNATKEELAEIKKIERTKSNLKKIEHLLEIQKMLDEDASRIEEEIHRRDSEERFNRKEEELKEGLKIYQEELEKVKKSKNKNKKDKIKEFGDQKLAIETKLDKISNSMNKLKEDKKNAKSKYRIMPTDKLIERYNLVKNKSHRCNYALTKLLSGEKWEDIELKLKDKFIDRELDPRDVIQKRIKDIKAENKNTEEHEQTEANTKVKKEEPSLNETKTEKSNSNPIEQKQIKRKEYIKEEQLEKIIYSKEDIFKEQLKNIYEKGMDTIVEERSSKLEDTRNRQSELREQAIKRKNKEEVVPRKREELEPENIPRKKVLRHLTEKDEVKMDTGYVSDEVEKKYDEQKESKTNDEVDMNSADQSRSEPFISRKRFQFENSEDYDLDDKITIKYIAETDTYIMKDSLSGKEKEIQRDRNIDSISFKEELENHYGVKIDEIKYVDNNILNMLIEYDKENNSERALDYLLKLSRTKLENQEYDYSNIEIFYELKTIYDELDNDKREHMSNTEIRDMMKIANNAMKRGAAKGHKGWKVWIMDKMDTIAELPIFRKGFKLLPISKEGKTSFEEEEAYIDEASRKAREKEAREEGTIIEEEKADRNKEFRNRERVSKIPMYIEHPEERDDELKVHGKSTKSHEEEFEK